MIYWPVVTPLDRLSRYFRLFRFEMCLLHISSAECLVHSASLCWGQKSRFDSDVTIPMSTILRYNHQVWLMNTFQNTSMRQFLLQLSIKFHARLKNKIGNNSTWEVAFYQSEWVKTNSSSVIFIFSLHVYYC